MYRWESGWNREERREERMYKMKKEILDVEGMRENRKDEMILIQRGKEKGEVKKRREGRVKLYTRKMETQSTVAQ